MRIRNILADRKIWYKCGMQRIVAIKIPAEGSGKTVLEYLVGRFTYHTIEEWREIIQSGRVTLNGVFVNPDHMLTAGEKLAYDVSGIPEPPVDPSFEVIHADPELLVINKSGNLPCHPAGRYFNHTLWAQLKSAGVCETPYFVNRLDRETSGLVVVARTAEAARACRTQFATRQVEKRYLALVEGIFPVEPWQANGWLLPDEGDGVRKKRRFVLATDGFDAPANGEWSETGLKLIRQLDEIALVEVTPVTGRLHQIRATLWSIGFPLVGDKLYGLDVSWFDRFRKNDLSAHDWQRLRMKRQALHAAGLRFCHPHDGRELKFEVPLPADMRALACY